MPIPFPAEGELQDLLGGAYPIWQAMRREVEALYEMELVWNKGGKAAVYELKYRRGGKTLCSLYAKQSEAACMLVFGGEERAKAEPLLPALPEWARAAYEGATTYHDGKWVWFPLTDEATPAALLPLLRVKRRPNRR